MKQKNTSSKTSILKSIGPGFLLAGAAIGVSHLVQATRAGADYGFILIWVLIVACISKYPFLEFGPRFAAGTGNHLITGFNKHTSQRNQYINPVWEFTQFFIASNQMISGTGGKPGTKFKKRIF